MPGAGVANGQAMLQESRTLRDTHTNALARTASVHDTLARMASVHDNPLLAEGINLQLVAGNRSPVQGRLSVKARMRVTHKTMSVAQNME